MLLTETRLQNTMLGLWLRIGNQPESTMQNHIVHQNLAL